MNFQKTISKIMAMSVIFSVLVLSSCMKMNMDTMPMLNINYPAAYVVNGEDASISVVKLSTNEVSETISLMGTGSDMVMWPHHISTHSTHLAIGVPGMDLSAGHTVSGSMAGKLLVVDATTGMTVKNVNLPLMNHNTIYSPNGTEIWTSQMDVAGKILVYDATTYALKNTITVGKEPAEVTFSNDGTVAFVANGMDNTVTSINPTTKAILATIPVGNNPVGAWVGSDNRMYVDNEDGQTVSVIDVKTLKVVETITLGFMPGYVAYQGDMKEMWVTDPTAGKVHWWTKDSSGKLVHSGAFATAAGTHAIAFNGMVAYVTNQSAGSVSVVDVMQHKVTKTIAVGKKPNGIAIKM